MKITAGVLVLFGCAAFASATGWNNRPCRVPLVEDGRTVLNGKDIQKYRANIRYGDVISYECNEGFELSGSNHRRCGTKGELSGNAAECIEIVQCKVPEAPTNGIVSETTGNKVDVGFKIEYRCNSGFKLDGTEKATCQSKGKFSSNPPICEPVKCVVPNAPVNGDVLTKPGSQVSVGSEIKFTCNKAFTLLGDDATTCQHDGIFFPEPPICQSVKCVVPNAPTDGNVSEEPGIEVEFGDSINYHCNKGFEMIGAESATCQIDGEFSTKSPTCRKSRPCGAPLTKKEGRYTGVIQTPIHNKQRSYTHGQTVYFHCPNYVRVTGTRSSTCKDGSWMPTPTSRCRAY